MLFLRRMIGRVVILAVTVWCAATLAFLLVHLAPGSPAIALMGDSGAPGLAEDIARRHGLDRPLIQIYLSWLAALSRGEFGVSYLTGRPVLALVAERLPTTLALVAPAMVLSTAIGVAVGLAGRSGPHVSHRGFVATMACLHALPSYLVGQGLIIVFALWLGILPVQGLQDARAISTAWGTTADIARHLVLPVMALSLHHISFAALLTRARIGEELSRPYAVTAAAKGASPWQVRLGHALPNVLPAIVSLLGIRLGAFLAGAIVIETVFALPGLGRLIVTAALARDHPVVIGIVLLTTAVVVVTNLLVDALLAHLHPRFAEHDG